MITLLLLIRFGLLQDVCIGCEVGKYGNFCSKDCPQFCHDNECHVTSGKCLSCKQGYYKYNDNNCLQCPEICTTCNSNLSCFACKSGYKGNVCEDVCPNCKPGTNCDKNTGYCFDSCSEGLSGELCDMKCDSKCKSCDRHKHHECISCADDEHGMACKEECFNRCLKSTCNESHQSCSFGCLSGYWGEETCNQSCLSYCKNSVCNITCIELVPTERPHSSTSNANIGLILGPVISIIAVISASILVFDIMKSRKTKLKDYSGKKLSAKTVFALAIKYLRDHLMKESSKPVGEAITDSYIRWVLTVPAIWNDSAKQFMREAAEEAGIPPNKLTICLEPEGASLFCQYSKMELCQGKQEISLDIFKPGTKYLLIDAGGGTVDITVHEVMPSGELRELHQATSGDWGGKKVNDEFEIMLRNIVGEGVLSKLKDQNMADYIDLLGDFEHKKRKISLDDNSNIYLRIPLTLSELVKQMTNKSLSECIEGSTYKQKLAVIGDKVKINTDLMKSLFDGSITNILNHVDLLLKDHHVSGCKIIVMVGGYSESPLLQARAYERFRGRKVIIPCEAGLAIMKGAIIYGYKPKSIIERVCKYTYGHDTTHISSSSCNHLKGKQTRDRNGDMRCHDIFTVHARINQTVKIGVQENEHIVHPISDDQTEIVLDIFSSTSRNPNLVTEPECKKIGTLTIPIRDVSLGRKRNFGVSFIFGGTEIEVKVVDKASGKIYRTSLSQLNDRNM